MKQMRSRFRLIALLLACAFVLTLALCTGSVLKTAGISLTDLSAAAVPDSGASPGPSLTPDLPAEAETSFPPPEPTPAGTDLPGTDNSPDPEYNTFGL